jgi:arylsulfate sulfotransferase
MARERRKSAVNLTFFSHEGFQMPNGDIVTLITDERVADQGHGPVDVLGDAVVVFDSYFHLKWFWDAFDYLDVKRVAPNNPICPPAGAGCPPFYNRQSNGQYYQSANDWTHANSVTYDARDGNLLVSLRHQSWVIKIAYQNGSGDGRVLWRLGPGGDFHIANGGSSSEWFSFQHDAGFQPNGLLALFDNNNLATGADSRGQAWQLDGANLEATPVVNINLGVRSTALGSAALLNNGNYTFGAGFVNAVYAQNFEVTPAGSVVFKEQTDQVVYGYFRQFSMYSLP